MTIAPSHSNGLFPTYKNAFSLIYIITHRHMIVKIICIKRLYVMGKNGNKVSPSDTEEHRFLSVHWLKRQHLPLGFDWSWCLVPAGSGCVLRLSSWLLIQLWQDRPFENETFSNRRFPTKRLIKFLFQIISTIYNILFWYHFYDIHVFKFKNHDDKARKTWGTCTSMQRHNN